jgi:L-iditol 2-dehydrogenase
MGHEFSGIVAKGSEKWMKKHVVSEITTACGKCHFCRIGERYHCINRKALGVTMDASEYVKVPEKNVHEIAFSFAEGIEFYR